MKLDYQNSIYLNSALGTTGLKTKHISGENWIKLLNNKRQLKNSIDALVNDEKEAAKECGFNLDDRGALIPINGESDVSKWRERLETLHKNFSVEVDVNFIPQNEFREYTKEMDTNVEAILFEYLMEQK